ncbi:MAG TPA: dTMP kinase [Anaerolineae bacterium]|nr:dTMP kinase [Anaerolineae bacterium]
MPKNSAGKLIAITGLPASGKTTLINGLKAALGRACFVSQPPKEWQRDPRVQALLEGRQAPGFTEEDEIDLSISLRYRQQQREILPCLERGVDVVVHRYLCCLLAYYYATGSIPLAAIEAKAQSILKPDVSLYLDIPAACSIQRTLSRQKPFFAHQVDPQFIGRMRAGYLKLGERNGAFVLDGTLPGEWILEAALEVLWVQGVLIGEGVKDSSPANEGPPVVRDELGRIPLHL